ncbi:hypothetical protein GobsT_62430 [Gemmata obscuriglobus]|uniref:Glycine zipper domain-containing protein n=1 Tax=Gemmata obscuriglobus TaxID=114 RepID=A0A2Z3GWS0_9BACT|nr:glycine zipper domain-containing protein [Gemmata obscuriglobus]AWM36007.1 hypothetical protein C1280_02615 [Gemmata obscuriglobus]QEG31422.1 hypothetical protein GobsT_62430 [Gemmata obscuriglobus]VTS10763.1 Hypothetical conserved protein OS=uncultured planctomycete GN=HGMM_F11F07C25 PE=4 SV=1: Gly-zipper_Omp [Gemmata obscuriglobus UQM 2246]
MVHTNFRRLLALGALAFAAGGSGCSTMNNTERGAAIGGTGGAAVGAGIGALTGRPVAGALIGGGLGAAGGALVGNDVDKREQRDREVAQAAALADARAAGQRVGVFDVIRMAQEGQDDQVIINQIRSTGSTFLLEPSDLSELKRNGVSARVITEMQATRPAARPTRVVVREPGPVIYESPPPVVVVRPRPVYVGPPPPYRYGYGYGYRHW